MTESRPAYDADQRECRTCGYDARNHFKEAHMLDPYPFCLTCPDHEACATGAPCNVVKAVAAHVEPA